jgi:hypothetical protein
MKKLVGLTGLLIALTLPTISRAAYWPDNGSFYYDGALYAESYMRWSSSGPWGTADPGYEHDVGASADYFNSCTSYTNLPHGYNDCPTAHYDSDNFWAFGFGSWRSLEIHPQVTYFGYWNFGQPGWWYTPASYTYFNLTGQETYKRCNDSIFCAEGLRSTIILRGWLYWGQRLHGWW